MATELRMCSRAPGLVRAVAILLFGAAASCSWLPRHEPMPLGLVAPYGGTGDAIWAVAPFRNESGTSLANELAIADTLRNQLTEVHGLSALPVNRTINAMRSLGMGSVDTPADARRLAAALDVDAIVVGSITSWQPYHPPQLGLNLVLFANGAALQGANFDPVAFATSPVDVTMSLGDEPLSAVSVQLDGAANDVRCHVMRYAEGRHDPTSAMGPERYLKSMSEFEKFACFRATELLLEQERMRLSRKPAAQEQASAR